MSYYFFYSLFWLISLLPLRVLYLLSDLVCPIVYYVARYRRKVVWKNLKESFPDKSERELRQIERKFYRTFCDFFVEDIKLFSISKKQMMKRMTFSGLEWVKEEYENGTQLLFIYLGHFGNWEWIASLQYWLPEVHCSQIYHKLYNKTSNRIFLEIREQYGGECINMKDAYRRLLQLNRSGVKTLCGFISDQQPKWEAIHHFTPFLNHDTAVFIGTEHIAKRLGAKIVYGRMTRPRRGYYHCELCKMVDDLQAVPDYEATDLYMRMLEADIVKTPHLWLWTHKRWSRTKEEWMRRREMKNEE